jgi:hypothetical protein
MVQFVEIFEGGLVTFPKKTKNTQTGLKNFFNKSVGPLVVGIRKYGVQISIAAHN